MTQAPAQNAHGQPIGPPVDGWSERPRKPRTPLLGKFSRVEPINTERHAAQLFDAWSAAPDDRDWTYLFAERPASLDACKEYVAKLEATADPMHFAIVDLADETAVGTAALMRIDPAHGVIEVGSITYSPRLKQTRAGTEAMYLMMHHCFEDLGYRRYEWKLDNLNAPSHAAARRYGFTYEGLFRQAVVYKNRNRDTAWYSITDSEWPRIRAGFEAWLSDGNFDETGKQRRSLVDMRN